MSPVESGQGSGPLDGIRVVELATVVSGPFACFQLAQLGADVVKVEPPEGDETRRFGPFHQGVSAYFWNLNRGKRSVVADLKCARDRRAVGELCVGADVVIENWRPLVATRLGLDHRTLSPLNARIITVGMRGFGETGPYAGRRVYDPIVQAVSGLAAFQGGRDGPDLVRTILPDKVSGLAAAQGVLAALVQRGRTGTGCHIEVRMLDAMLSFLFPDMFLARTFIDGPALRGGAARTAILQQCARGEWVVAATVTAQQFGVLADLIGRPELIARFPDASSRVAARHELHDILMPWFTARERDDVLTTLHAADIPAAPVNTIDDVIVDPQVVHNGPFTVRDRGEMGRIREASALFRIDDEAPSDLGRAPALGEHTAELLPTAR